MAKIFDSPEQFVRLYMEAYKNGDSMADFAKEHGAALNYVRGRASKLRAMGVRLSSLNKKFLDIAVLNQIVDDITDQMPPKPVPLPKKTEEWRKAAEAINKSVLKKYR